MLDVFDKGSLFDSDFTATRFPFFADRQESASERGRVWPYFRLVKYYNLACLSTMFLRAISLGTVLQFLSLTFGNFCP